MRFDATTMRLSIRTNGHDSTLGAAVWTKARIAFGGPLLLATSGPATTREEARKKVMASLASVESVETALATAQAYVQGLETQS